MKKIFTSFLLAITLQGFSQSMVTDSTFGNNGQVFSNRLGNTASGTTNIFRQPDDKILLCGAVRGTGNNFFNTMFRVDCAGKIDSSFGINGLVKHRFVEKNNPYSYKLLSTGKIAVVGVQAISVALADQLPFIARYNANGSPDTSFGSATLSTYSQELSSVYELSGGKLLATGGLLLAKFDSVGSPDLAFGTNGIKNIPTPPGFVPTPLTGYLKANSVMRTDGKIISAMPAYFNVLGNYNSSFICYDTTGLVDSTFGTNGFIKETSFYIANYPPRLLAQSNNKILAISNSEFSDKIVIAKYGANGFRDNTFGTNGILNITSSQLPISLVYYSMLDDNSFIIGYTENSGTCTFKKFTATGTLVPSFSIDGSNEFQFENNTQELPQVGLSSGNNEIIMGSMLVDYDCRAALTRFVENSSSPHITEALGVLNSNVSNSGATFQWLLDGNAIPNATNSTHNATQTGTYSVIVTNAWGCEQSDDFEVNTVVTGINETIAEMLSVYPNPAKDVLHITWGNTDKNATIELLDITGRVAITKIANSLNSTDINVQSYAKGVYLLKLSTANSISTKKVLVE
jgi:uncharacterized delta-60 repeat protein